MLSSVRIERELEGTPFLSSSSFPSLVYSYTSWLGMNLILTPKYMLHCVSFAFRTQQGDRYECTEEKEKGHLNIACFQASAQEVEQLTARNNFSGGVECLPLLVFPI